MMISDPRFLTSLEFVFPFLGYYAGIVIRKVALNKPGSPPLKHQLLLGIPLSLVTVSPLLYLFEAALKQEAFVGAISAYLVNLGLIMGTGMTLPEAATKQLQNWIKRATTMEPAPEQRPSAAA